MTVDFGKRETRLLNEWTIIVLPLNFEILDDRQDIALAACMRSVSGFSFNLQHNKRGELVVNI